MARPKGSKNKSTIEIEELQKQVKKLESQHNSYSDVLDSFVDGFVMDMFNQGMIKTIDINTLQTWFNSPDEYMTQITSLLTYYYIIDGSIFQLFDLVFTLPKLNYKITAIYRDENYREDMRAIKYLLEKKIRHKELTRDLLSQLASKGTLLGTWLGNSKDPYFNVFDDLQYIYPYGRYRGKMIGVIDLKWLDEMNEEQRERTYNNLKPLVTKRKYEKYKSNTDSSKDKELRFITLPVEKSLVARTHTLGRNQRLGVPFGTQALFDMQHKQKLKELEKSIANKIIRAIAVLKFRGKDENDVRVKKSDKDKVFKGVRKALEKNIDQNGITVVAIPDFASLDTGNVKDNDKALSPEKYKSIDNDISNATITSSLTTGENSNYATAKIDMEILYEKIGVLLEQIEVIYNQLFEIVLGERGQNYIFEYDKGMPISKEKKLDTLKSLQANGFSTKYVLDLLGIDADEYFEESFYEIEKLKLRDKIIPPLSQYTISDKIGGRPGDNNSNNPSTIDNQQTGGNIAPKAGV